VGTSVAGGSDALMEFTSVLDCRKCICWKEFVAELTPCVLMCVYLYVYSYELNVLPMLPKPKACR